MYPKIRVMFRMPQGFEEEPMFSVYLQVEERFNEVRVKSDMYKNEAICYVEALLVGINTDLSRRPLKIFGHNKEATRMVEEIEQKYYDFRKELYDSHHAAVSDWAHTNCMEIDGNLDNFDYWIQKGLDGAYLEEVLGDPKPKAVEYDDEFGTPEGYHEDEFPPAPEGSHGTDY